MAWSRCSRFNPGSSPATAEMQPEAGLVVMARWPGAGRCKGRLARDLNNRLNLACSGERSARVQRQLCGHTFAVARSAQQRGRIDPVLAVSGVGPRGARRWGRQQGIQRVRRQGEGSLGTLLKQQLLLEQRWRRPTLVIGTDLPDLSHEHLHTALARLEPCDLVLGPATDGGYWLIGFSRRLMRNPAHWPLIDIPWGGADVCEATLAVARRVGLSVALLPRRCDIDHLEDLKPWQG